MRSPGWLFCLILVLAPWSAAKRVSGAVFESSQCAGVGDLVLQFVPPKDSGKATVVTKTDDDGEFAVDLSKSEYYVSVLFGAQQLYGKVVSIDPAKPLNIVLQSEAGQHTCSCKDMYDLALARSEAAQWRSSEVKATQAVYKHALTICSQKAIEDPSYKSMTIRVLRSLGHFYRDTDQITDAELAYENALQLDREGVKTRNVTEEEVAKDLLYLALLHDMTLRQREAYGESREAISIFTKYGAEDYLALSLIAAALASQHQPYGGCEYARAAIAESRDYLNLTKQLPQRLKREVETLLLNCRIISP